jgi:hypothetical protein
VVSIIDMFLEKNLLVTYTVGPNEDWTQHYYARTDPHPNKPMTILIRGDSASGSEMLAGALKAHGRALVIGETSYGKGSGQTLKRLDTDRDRWLRLTIFKYYLPDQTSIHESGVKPDIVQETDRIESWQYDWQTHLQRAEVVETYGSRTMAEHADLFHRLADFDGYDTSQYPAFENLFREAVSVLYEARRTWTRAKTFPAFEEFLAQHDTPAARDFIRLLVRRDIRRRVQDERARPFIQDFQEDLQLQRAIYETLHMAEVDPASVPEYRRFAGKFR